jgi:hypothetical protein
MNKKLLTMLLLSSAAGAQSLVSSVNSGCIVGPGGSVSVGEIVVVADTPGQAQSGLIGILGQFSQPLEVPELEIASGITVYPNPTVSKIYFASQRNLIGQSVSVYDAAGKLMLSHTVAPDESLSLETLAPGLYVVCFADQKINSFKIIKH